MTITAPIHTSAQSIDRVLGAGVPVLLMFGRRGCQPCDQLAPTLETLAAAYAGRALVARVDAPDNPGLVQRFGVTHLPGLVFVQGGKVVAQASGAAPEAALRAWLEHLTADGSRPPLPEGPRVALNGSVATPPTAPAGPPAASPGKAGAPLVLMDATFDQVVGSSATPVLVDFWAPWCGPCRTVAPAIERLAQEFAGRAVVAKLNVDEHPRAAQRFGISSIPALYLFKGGKVVERLVGAQPESVLRQALARHTGA
ncbi:MAG: thioredoxin [Chloroflexales bacterium]|nr:thioredoxin [Chloroflexales bacterium]